MCFQGCCDNGGGRQCPRGFQVVFSEVCIGYICLQADLWLYNFSEVSNKKLGDKLSKIHEWQSCRVGLAHHLLVQKLGLFQHTQARDIHQYTKVGDTCTSTPRLVTHAPVHQGW